MKFNRLVIACTSIVGLLSIPAVATATPTTASAPGLTVSSPTAFATPHQHSITFAAKLSALSPDAVTVAYDTVNGTAVGGTDFTATSGSLTIAPGTTTARIKVPLIPAALGAGGPTKTFQLALSSPVGAVLTSATATGTILPDVYAVSALNNFQDVVVSPNAGKAYLAEPAVNDVAVLNLRTGKFEKPIPVGSDPNSMDLTPDGTELLVADSGGDTMSEIDLATRAVTTIVLPGQPRSVAVTDNGYALWTPACSCSGFFATYKLNLSTGVSSTIPFLDSTELTNVFSSANHDVIGGEEGDTSNGEDWVYTASTGTFVTGGLGVFNSSGAISGNGSTMLIDSAFVVDTKSCALFGTISGSGFGEALNYAGTEGYRLESSSVQVIQVSRFLPGASINLPASAAGGNALAISPDDHVLVATTSDSATIIQV